MSHRAAVRSPGDFEYMPRVAEVAAGVEHEVVNYPGAPHSPRLMWTHGPLTGAAAPADDTR